MADKPTKRPIVRIKISIAVELVLHTRIGASH